MLIAFQQTHQMFAKLWLARERLELAFSLKEPDRTLLTRDDDLQRECVLRISSHNRVLCGCVFYVNVVGFLPSLKACNTFGALQN
jgi:hypothetical protein